MRKLLWIILTVSAVLFGSIGSPSARAGTIYTYSGNTFTTCNNVFVNAGTGACQGAVSLSFETSLEGSALDNLSDADIQSTLLSATAAYSPLGAAEYGGEIECTFGCAGPQFFQIQISTNAGGDITAWNIFTSNAGEGGPVEAQITSTNFKDTGEVVTGGGGISFCGGVPCQSEASVSMPGVWSAPVGTPEPGAGLLVLVGIGSLLALASLKSDLKQTNHTNC